MRWLPDWTTITGSRKMISSSFHWRYPGFGCYDVGGGGVRLESYTRPSLGLDWVVQNKDFFVCQGYLLEEVAKRNWSCQIDCITRRIFACDILIV